jgi:ketosteroid isomerase-like protein
LAGEEKRSISPDREGEDPADARDAHQQRDVGVIGVAFAELSVDGVDLALEIVDQLHRGGDIAAPGLGNVDAFKRRLDAYNRGDIDGMLENWASDAVLDWSRGLGFDARVYRGRGEIRAFAQRFLATWDEVRFEIVDGPVEIEDGLLITEKLAYLRGRDGIEVQARSAWLITIRAGETTSLTLYQTKQDALEAAGLRD